MFQLAYFAFLTLPNVGNRPGAFPNETGAPSPVSLTPGVGVDVVSVEDWGELKLERKMVLHSDFERLRLEIENELTAIKRDFANLQSQFAKG